MCMKDRHPNSVQGDQRPFLVILDCQDSVDGLEDAVLSTPSGAGIELGKLQGSLSPEVLYYLLDPLVRISEPILILLSDI